jgi:hypothetical protein
MNASLVTKIKDLGRETPETLVAMNATLVMKIETLRRETPRLSP